MRMTTVIILIGKKKSDVDKKLKAEYDKYVKTNIHKLFHVKI